MFYDATYILVLIGAAICLLASSNVTSTFNKFSRVRNHAGVTGAQAAMQILHSAGIYDVPVVHVSGNLTDHYDPSSRTVRLSDATYNSPSVAALGVAAHECGHAIQHETNYLPLHLRSAIVPAANIGSQISWPMIIIGLMFRGNMSVLFLNLGIIFFCFAVAFQVVTLPVEFNASSRALRILDSTGLLYPEEVGQARKVLTAAALTYVASVAQAVLQLLRLLIITGGRRNRD